MSKMGDHMLELQELGDFPISEPTFRDEIEQRQRDVDHAASVVLEKTEDVLSHHWSDRSCYELAAARLDLTNKETLLYFAQVRAKNSD